METLKYLKSELKKIATRIKKNQCYIGRINIAKMDVLSTAIYRLTEIAIKISMTFSLNLKKGKETKQNKKKSYENT